MFIYSDANTLHLQLSICSCIEKASIFVSDKARKDKAPVGWEELEVTRKELYVAGEELEL